MSNSKVRHFWLALLVFTLPAMAFAVPTGTMKADPVVEWNATALDLLRQTDLAPAEVARDLAILHLAIFEAVNAIQQKYEPYSTTIKVAPGASAEAAAIAAGHRILASFFPNQLNVIDEKMKQFYAGISADDQSKKNGIEVGREIAKMVLADRAKDNSGRTVNYKSGRQPGKWRAAPGDERAALLPHWSSVTPFALDLGSQFRPEPPPALNSAQYALEVEQVRKIGGRDSQERTREQTQIAYFWDVDVPALWNDVAETVVLNKRLSLIDSARTFALLNIALADAGIATWDTKYRYNSWRPVSAITHTTAAAHPDITYEGTWMPLISSRPVPEYISAHAAYSSAAAKVLASLFGDSLRFSVRSDSEQAPGPRSFNSFSQAAEEAGMSRIYGGIQFPSGNREGLKLGRSVGDYVVENVLIVDENAKPDKKQGF